MIDLTQKRYWIFDLDGTLTKPVHDFAYIRHELGLAPDVDILSAISSQSKSRKRTMLARLDELERYYAAQAQPADGVIELLNVLQEKQCYLGILTRNTYELALLSLDAIGALQFFAKNHVLGRDDITPKPSPDGINFLLNQWSANKDQAVMVGDFYIDLLSGRAASISTVHVDEIGRHWPDETDMHVNSLLDLYSHLIY